MLSFILLHVFSHKNYSQRKLPSLQAFGENVIIHLNNFKEKIWIFRRFKCKRWQKGKPKLFTRPFKQKTKSKCFLALVSLSFFSVQFGWLQWENSWYFPFYWLFHSFKVICASLTLILFTDIVETFVRSRKQSLNLRKTTRKVLNKQFFLCNSFFL